MSDRPLYRATAWVLVGGKLLGAWGLTWDIQWHLQIGRDSFWIPPHLMMYGGVTAGLIVTFALLALETARARRRPPGPDTIRVLGLVGTRGLHLAAWGVALVILAAPIDDLWHRLFGLDVTLWSPPHLLGLLGSGVNTLGTLLIVTEVYERRRRARLAGLVLGGALLYIGVRVVLEPAWLVAWTHGGVLFHAFALLGALLLPLALVPAGRLLERRWAPLVVVAVALAISVIGEQIAQVGFAVIQPLSVIGQAIQNDPTSTIAQAAAIRAKSRGVVTPFWLRLLFPLTAAAVMSAADVRRRPTLACAAYGIVLVAVYGWSTSRSPAFAALVPTAVDTAIALAIAAVAGGLGAVGGRYLADALASTASSAVVVEDRMVTAVTR
ncbi:MAG: hypothetical protein E6K82_05965 [Candidatus Rokuibacteriota bacterium]|nr:MAG: hypothetical protein E6K82_05965 [Candidatus Rokubacteria bacterium]